MLLDPMSPLFMRWSYLPTLLPWLIPFLRNGERKERLDAIIKALADIAPDCVDQHLTLAKGTPAEQFIQTGYYTYAYPSRAEYEADAMGHALRREYGIDYDELTDGKLQENDPELTPEYTFGAAYKDHGWVTSPGKYTAALAGHFLVNGGKFHKGEVKDIAPTETGARITLEGGQELKADKVVLSAGVWSRRFAERLGHKCPMVAERGHHLMMANPSYRPPYPTMIAAGKLVITPMEDGLRAAGTLEFAPNDAPENPRALTMMRAHVKRAYPNVTWENEETWMGRRPSTTDSLPVIGASPRAPHVIFAFGAQHIGLTLGPKTGRMVADIAADRRTNIDLAPFRPDRFDA